MKTQTIGWIGLFGVVGVPGIAFLHFIGILFWVLLFIFWLLLVLEFGELSEGRKWEGPLSTPLKAWWDRRKTKGEDDAPGH